MPISRVPWGLVSECSAAATRRQLNSGCCPQSHGGPELPFLPPSGLQSHLGRSGQVDRDHPLHIPSGRRGVRRRQGPGPPASGGAMVPQLSVLRRQASKLPPSDTHVFVKYHKNYLLEKYNNEQAIQQTCPVFIIECNSRRTFLASGSLSSQGASQSLS